MHHLVAVSNQVVALGCVGHVHHAARCCRCQLVTCEQLARSHRDAGIGMRFSVISPAVGCCGNGNRLLIVEDDNILFRSLGNLLRLRFFAHDRKLHAFKYGSIALVRCQCLADLQPAGFIIRDGNLGAVQVMVDDVLSVFLPESSLVRIILQHIRDLVIPSVEHIGEVFILSLRRCARLRDLVLGCRGLVCSDCNQILTVFIHEGNLVCLSIQSRQVITVIESGLVGISVCSGLFPISYRTGIFRICSRCPINFLPVGLCLIRNQAAACSGVKGFADMNERRRVIRQIWIIDMLRTVHIDILNTVIVLDDNIRKVIVINRCIFI